MFEQLVRAAEEVCVLLLMLLLLSASRIIIPPLPHSLPSPPHLHGKVVTRFSSIPFSAHAFMCCQPPTTCGQVCWRIECVDIHKQSSATPYHPPTGVLDGFYRWPHPFHDNLRLVHHNRMSSWPIPEAEEDCTADTPGLYCTACCRRMVWLRGRVRVLLGPLHGSARL